MTTKPLRARRNRAVLGTVLTVGTLVGGSGVALTAYGSRTLTDQRVSTQVWTSGIPPTSLSIDAKFGTVTVVPGPTFKITARGTSVGNEAAYIVDRIDDAYVIRSNDSWSRHVNYVPIKERESEPSLIVTVPEPLDLSISGWATGSTVSGSYKHVGVYVHGPLSFMGAADTLELTSTSDGVKVQTTGLGPYGMAPVVALTTYTNVTADFTATGVSRLSVASMFGDTTVTLPPPFEQYVVRTTFAENRPYPSPDAGSLNNAVGSSPGGNTPVEVYLDMGRVTLERAAGN
ncbi:hypothetical protein JT358_09410 [Micrococcales bacterium 31B]|nr:hypothetical protein [Micrococcales bacterium 31B]